MKTNSGPTKTTTPTHKKIIQVFDLSGFRMGIVGVGSVDDLGSVRIVELIVSNGIQLRQQT
jgi:hypothetical protein